jgi:hypothetical protein
LKKMIMILCSFLIAGSLIGCSESSQKSEFKRDSESAPLVLLNIYEGYTSFGDGGILDILESQGLSDIDLDFDFGRIEYSFNESSAISASGKIRYDMVEKFSDGDTISLNGYVDDAIIVDYGVTKGGFTGLALSVYASTSDVDMFFPGVDMELWENLVSEVDFFAYDNVSTKSGSFSYKIENSDDIKAFALVYTVWIYRYKFVVVEFYKK